MSDMPEFSRRFPLAEIGTVPKHVAIVADDNECAAVARRFELVSLELLSAKADLVAVEGAIEARGTMLARLTQSCVATGQPLLSNLDEPFRIRFEPPVTEVIEEEFELDADDCDAMEHDGQAVDLGEAIAQTLGLSIDRFPRAPNADEVLKAAGIIDKADTSPFAKLKGLFAKE